MIKENQKILNLVHVITDGIFIFLSFPVSFWIRFHILNGIVSVPLKNYLFLAAAYTVVQLFTYASFGLYRSFRNRRLRTELLLLLEATLLDMLALQSLLLLSWGVHYSRLVLIMAFMLGLGVLSAKRIMLRLLLRQYRQRGYNRKHVIIAGGGRPAQKYLREIRTCLWFGYSAVGYVADRDNDIALRRLGSFDEFPSLLERHYPDEVVAALDVDDFQRMPEVIEACENAGVRLSVIPFYAEYMSSKPQFDALNSIPLLKIRQIPLDNWSNAFCKRVMDLIGSAVLLTLFSPVLLLCAAGVKLSSPGPILFRQKRIGRDKKPFYMYKFRSMRVNDDQDTAWSKKTDDRKTPFGAFMRKCSLDELPQLWNVLCGEMSLVGPRPELPHYVERFRHEVPLYMVKHQVRPGITGWAQVNGYRGDTSIKGRIEHDVYYIENWSLGFDMQILFMTIFQGKFFNDEQMTQEKKEKK